MWHTHTHTQHTRKVSRSIRRFSLSVCFSFAHSLLRWSVGLLSNALNCRINFVDTQQILHATHVLFPLIVFEPGVNFNHYIVFTRTSKFMEIEHIVTLIKSTMKWNKTKRLHERTYARTTQRWNLKSFFIVLPSATLP